MERNGGDVETVLAGATPCWPGDTTPNSGGLSLRRRELLIAAGVCAIACGGAAAQLSVARRLTLKNVNTGETFDGTYRDAEGPIPEAVADLALLLRDHHANKVGPVDIDTIDFLADVMAVIGQTKAMILSAYRTPETNAKLAATTFGVAEKSQHMFGRALDVSFDRRLADAQRAARGMGRGGVGWYPRSHFIHLDTGPTRNWEIDGSGLDILLAGQRLGSPRAVAARMERQRALARREFLARHFRSAPTR